MKARPILFSGEMVRALLDGRKTQTRRVIKPQPELLNERNGAYRWDARIGSLCGIMGSHIDGFPKSASFHCPHGQRGDLLWVRETFIHGGEYDEFGCPIIEGEEYKERVWYRATDSDLIWYHDGEEISAPKWKPSIFMPKWVSRLTLEITDIRVERLQDITRGDAMDEGCPFPNIQGKENPVSWYENLWQSINGKDSWAANPWVWVIEFEVHHKNVLEMLS